MRETTDGEVFASSVDRPEMVSVIFDRHARALLSYLTRRLGAADAEDILSEVFVIALERRESFDPEVTSARPWLYGIAANLLHKRRRQEARFLKALARTVRDPGLGILDDRAESAVESRIDAERAAASMSGALAALAARDRDVLLLVAWAELTHAEIAESLSIPVGTVKSRLHRARRELRAHLDQSTAGREPDITERRDRTHG